MELESSRNGGSNVAEVERRREQEVLIEPGKCEGWVFPFTGTDVRASRTA